MVCSVLIKFTFLLLVVGLLLVPIFGSCGIEPEPAVAVSEDNDSADAEADTHETANIQSNPGEKIVHRYLGEFKLTAYCGCRSCSGIYGTQTATGVTATEGVTIAVDPKVIPYGTHVYIEGVGERIAQDCGGAIKGNKIDIFVSNHSDAYKPEYNCTTTVWLVERINDTSIV